METTDIHILGGGPAGLTTGYYAKKYGFTNFAIFEAGEHAGGNCRTLKIKGVDCQSHLLQNGDFRFDTGAHRFHGKDPQVTEEVKNLLGDDLLRVAAPSEIFFQEKFYRFPLLLSDSGAKTGNKDLAENRVGETTYSRQEKPFGKFRRIRYQSIRKKH